MQKFTIFSVIFALIVLSISAELLIQDYAKELYPPPTASLISTLDDLDESQPVPTAEPDDTEIPVPETPDDENLEPIESDLPTSDKIVDLLGTLDISNLKYVPQNYNGKLFDVLTTEGINPDDVAFGLLVQDADKQIAATYDFQFTAKTDARRLYLALKDQARTLANIDINETNQFGDSSFYINHAAKVNEVFLVALAEDHLFAFVYTRDVHEAFKPFLGLLM